MGGYYLYYIIIDKIVNYINLFFRLPVTTIDAHLLRYLSRLRINCMNSLSFHRIIRLLSSVFGQLCQFSLKLQAFTSISDPLIIIGDIIQQLCIDCLQPMATYTLNLLLYATDPFEEKIVFKSFLKVAFTQRQRPRVFIYDLDEQDIIVLGYILYHIMTKFFHYTYSVQNLKSISETFIYMND